MLYLFARKILTDEFKKKVVAQLRSEILLPGLGWSPLEKLEEAHLW
jgi:hypothetical protein